MLSNCFINLVIPLLFLHLPVLTSDGFDSYYVFTVGKFMIPSITVDQLLSYNVFLL